MSGKLSLPDCNTGVLRKALDYLESWPTCDKSYRVHCMCDEPHVSIYKNTSQHYCAYHPFLPDTQLPEIIFKVAIPSSDKSCQCYNGYCGLCIIHNLSHCNQGSDGRLICERKGCKKPVAYTMFGSNVAKELPDSTKKGQRASRRRQYQQLDGLPNELVCK